MELWKSIAWSCENVSQKAGKICYMVVLWKISAKAHLFFTKLYFVSRRRFWIDLFFAKQLFSNKLLLFIIFIRLQIVPLHSLPFCVRTFPPYKSIVVGGSGYEIFRMSKAHYIRYKLGLKYFILHKIISHFNYKKGGKSYFYLTVTVLRLLHGELYGLH